MNRYEKRYWDGRVWTDAVSNNDVVESDPTPIPRAEPTTTGAVATGPVSGGMYSRPTSLSPQETRDRLGYLLPTVGITITGGDANRLDAVSQVPGEVNTVVFVLLLFLCIIGGIIYYVVAQKGRSLAGSFMLTPVGTGTLIHFSGSPEMWQRVSPALSQFPW